MASGLGRVLILVWFVHTVALKLPEQRGGGEDDERFLEDILTGHADAAAEPRQAEKKVMDLDDLANVVKTEAAPRKANAEGWTVSKLAKEMRMMDADVDNESFPVVPNLVQKSHQTVRVAMSYGDPHMQNVLGQRFDLMQQGRHTLVRIPRGSSQEDSLLSVGAQVSRVGASCQDMYIMEVNVTGAWMEQTGSGNLHFEAGVKRPQIEGKWLPFGPVGYTVDLKVVQGKTKTNDPYLNFFVRKLVKVGRHVGGLLGEDSHELAAMPSLRCQRAINLWDVAPIAEEMTRSVAQVELE